MVSTVNTVTIRGLEAIKTEIQVAIFSGLPCFTIVGMASKAVSEATTRITAALNTIGLDLPPKKVIVNLSPTDLTKDGNYYDLPIILAILSEIKIVQNFDYQKYIVIGELALNATIKSVGISLIAAIFANNEDMHLICPQKNGPLALISGNENIVAPNHLWQLINHLNGLEKLPQPKVARLVMEDFFDHDFSQIKGQPIIKRGLEIAAAGGHSIILQGPPGCGKTLSVECMKSIMPRLSSEEMIDICMIESLKNELNPDELNIKRPFRAPHHSASAVSIIGGGRKAEPGEVTLANRGILFLDELAEFSPAVLDALREPLETGFANISRAEKHITYPANFQLIGAMNPCKCGYFGDPEKECSKVPFCKINYQKKLSGPFLDRIDLFVNLTQSKDSRESIIDPHYQNSLIIRKRVENARAIQYYRYQKYEFKLNALVRGELEKLLQINNDALDFLKHIFEKSKASARSYNKILKVARTIADLANKEFIDKEDMLEAIYFRAINEPVYG